MTIKKRLSQAQAVSESPAELQKGINGLQANEARYRLLFETSPNALFLIGKDGHFLEANQAALDWYGYSLEEFKHMTPTDLAACDDLARKAPGKIKRAWQDPTHFEWRHRRRDGRELPVEINTIPIRIGAEAFTYVTVQDISERKLAELALQKSEQQFRGLYENTPIGIYRTALDGQILLANPALVSMLGYPTFEELAKRDLTRSGYALTHPRQDFHKLVEPTGKVSSIESAWKRKDGTTLFVLENARLVRDQHNQPLFYEGTAEDITQRKRMEMEQQALLEIMQGVTAPGSLHEFLSLVHQSLNTVMHAENFSVFFHHESSGLFEEVYTVDQFDAPMPPTKLSKSITAYVFSSGEPLLLTQAKFDELQAQGEVELIGTNSLSWLGAPLKPLGKTIGVMVVQNYELVGCYSDRDREFLASVCTQVSLAIERKQAEEDLFASEEKFKYIFDQSVNGASITLPTGEINVNRAFCEMLGYSATELQNKKWQQISHPGDVELTENEINALLSGQIDSARFTKRYLHKNGSVVWTDVGTTLRRTQDGKPLYFMTSITDITPRKQAEEALQKSEALLRSILDATPFPIAMLGVQDDRIDFWSRSALALFGQTAPTAAEWYLLAYPDPDYRRQVVERWKLALEKTRQSAQAFNTGEYRITCRDGSVRICELYATFLADSLIVTFNDITERKQIEEYVRQLNTDLEQRVEERTLELRAAQEKLVRQEKLAVLGQMAGSVGHELRNPLSVINNAIYLLKLVQVDASPQVKEYLGIIDQETHTADKIINDLLEFSRTKSVDRKSVPVKELLQRVLERFPAPEHVTVRIKLPADLPPVFADPRQITQVLGNLAVNACQAMALKGSATLPQGGRLTLSAKKNGRVIGISVTDTGTGITPENRSKLFEPLFTTKAKGIGLGLAVSLKLVEANDGRLEVQSEVGKGSTFTVWLPINE